MASKFGGKKRKKLIFVCWHGKVIRPLINQAAQHQRSDTRKTHSATRVQKMADTGMYIMVERARAA